jgi:hypothetical protein
MNDYQPLQGFGVVLACLLVLAALWTAIIALGYLIVTNV